MKRSVAAAAAVALALSVGFSAGPAASQEFPEHGHLFLTGLEFDESGEPVGFKKCRELANGQALPLNAHHEHLHFGTAGEAQNERAGNTAVPLAPFPGVPWTNCEEFIEIIFAE